jgi:hypothetical protein
VGIFFVQHSVLPFLRTYSEAIGFRHEKYWSGQRNAWKVRLLVVCQGRLRSKT